MKDIKAIVFDFGGVIELSGGNNILKSIAEVINIPIDDFKNEYFKYNHLSNVGNIEWGDMVMKVVSIFNKEKETKDKVLLAIKTYQSQVKLNTELLSLFPVLKHQGLKIAIFSNYALNLRDKLETNGVSKLVDKIVVSSEIGFQKPHKDAFEALFKLLTVLPQEVIFIDDEPKSLEKAGEIGYTPILFKNNDQLKVDLKNLGVAL